MNNNKLSLFVFLFALLTQTSAVSSQSLQTIPKIGIGINGLDFSVEIPVAEKIIIEPAVGLGPSYSFSNMDGLTSKMGYFWDLLQPSVHVSIHGKFFYNRDKRILKRKSILLNSGKFVGLKVKYVSTPLTNAESHWLTKTLLANLNWGGQRNIGRHWNYSYSMGLGYGHNIESSYGTFYPAFDLKIAYVLPLFARNNR